MCEDELSPTAGSSSSPLVDTEESLMAGDCEGDRETEPLVPEYSSSLLWLSLLEVGESEGEGKGEGEGGGEWCRLL